MSKKTTTNKTRPDLSIEKKYQGIIAGIDEVGRGPWAGPVVACSLLFLKPNLPRKLKSTLDDSKKLTEKKRIEVYEILTNSKDLCHWAIGEASVEEIDSLNIYHATFVAMQRSLSNLNQPVDVALIDGKTAPELPCTTVAIPQGDCKSVSIAAASVIAKIHRDQYMTQLAEQFPQYGWQHNAGYGTKIHQEALKEFGPTIHHRKSFAPIKELLEAA